MTEQELLDRQIATWKTEIVRLTKLIAVASSDRSSSADEKLVTAETVTEEEALLIERFRNSGNNGKRYILTMSEVAFDLSSKDVPCEVVDITSWRKPLIDG
jgi:hypothetical protein